MKFDTKSIFIPHTAKTGIMQKDLELDGTIPESLPDVARLISVDAKVGRTKIKVENGKAEVSADVVFGILYESDYRAKASYTTSETEFVQKTDLECGKEFYPDADVKCAFLSCKLLGPRRFVIRARMATKLECDSIEEVRTVDTDSTKVNAFFRTENAVFTTPCRTFTDERRVEGSASSPYPVSSVISVSAEAMKSEYSVSDGRLSVRTPITVKALCEGEDGKYFSVSASLPSLTTAEDTDIDDTKRFRIGVYASSPASSVESDDYGEQKVLRFACDVFMDAVCYETVTEELASDAFCADRSSECTVSAMDSGSVEEKKEKVISVEKTFDTERTDISRVIDTSAVFRVTETAVSDGKAEVKGVCTANVLVEDENGMSEISFENEFAGELPVGDADDVCHAEIVPVDASSTVTGGENINFRSTAVISVFTLSAKKTACLSSVTASDSPEDREERGVCFYYPEKGETSWDIAKAYGTDPKRLAENNENAFHPDGTLDENTVFVAIE